MEINIATAVFQVLNAIPPKVFDFCYWPAGYLHFKHFLPRFSPCGPSRPLHRPGRVLFHQSWPGAEAPLAGLLGSAFGKSSQNESWKKGEKPLWMKSYPSDVGLLYTKLKLWQDPPDLNNHYRWWQLKYFSGNCSPPKSLGKWNDPKFDVRIFFSDGLVHLNHQLLGGSSHLVSG